MRWTLFHYKKRVEGGELEEEEDNDSNETYGFRTMASAPAFPELKPFEDDLIALIGSIETKSANNRLQVWHLRMKEVFLLRRRREIDRRMKEEEEEVGRREDYIRREKEE